MPSYKQKKQKLRQLVKQEEEQRIKKIQQQGHNFVDSDKFKRMQKKYKNYCHLETNYNDVLNLEHTNYQQINGYKVYVLKQPQGAYLIKGFVSKQEQYQVGFEALNQFIFRPYRTNLDGTNGLYHQQSNNVKHETQSKYLQQQVGKQINPQKQNQKILQNIDFNSDQLPYYFNQKIRMANLGYQYDWPHRSYPATRVPIPSTVTKLTSRAKQLYQQIKKQQCQYHGQAIIVNYYKPKDYMTGHLDDGEQDQVNPIFSFCFGLSCIFLIGGTTREIQPCAIRLDAGDLLIMSGYSRVCYHGVPRIIEYSYGENDNLNVRNFEVQMEEALQKENIIQELKQIQQSITQQIDQKLTKFRQNTKENSKFKQQKEFSDAYKFEQSQIHKNEEQKHIMDISKRYRNGFKHINNYFKQHRLNINVRQVWVRKNEPQKQIKNQLTDKQNYQKEKQINQLQHERSQQRTENGSCQI